MVMEASLKEEEERVKKVEEVKKEEEQILTIVKQKSVKEVEVVQKTEEQVVHAVKMAEEVVEPSSHIEEEVKELAQPQPQMKPKKELLPGFSGYDLPPLSMKKGGAFDNDILRLQHEAIQKGLKSMDEELDNFASNQPKVDPFENKSMSEVLREKREATDKILESTKQNQQESVEERRQRLRATRDTLLKQKNDQRQNDLEDFKSKASNKSDLFRELKDMDSKIKPKTSGGSTIKFDQQMLEIENSADSSTQSVDKRLQLYKSLRDQMHSSIRQDHESLNRQQMEELNKKIEELERSQRQKEAIEQANKEASEQQRGQKNKGFLDGIKSFQVEDI